MGWPSTKSPLTESKAFLFYRKILIDHVGKFTQIRMESEFSGPYLLPGLSWSHVLSYSHFLNTFITAGINRPRINLFI